MKIFLRLEVSALRLFKYFKKEKGSISVIVAVAMIALLGITALAIDYGYLASEKRNFQNALDSAALAGVRELPDYFAAKQTAIDYLVYNGVDDAETRVNSGEILIYQSPDSMELTVTGTYDVDYLFAIIFGNGTSSKVGALATAKRPKDSFFADNDCALLALSETVPMKFSQTYMELNDPIHSNCRVELSSMNGSFAKISACQGIIKDASAGSVSIAISEGYAPKKEMPEVSDLVDAAQHPSDSKLASLGVEKIGNTYYIRSYGYTGRHAYDNLIEEYGDDPIYFPGDVILENGNFNSTGTILAKNNVTIRGTHTSMISTNSICFASVEGDIKIDNCSASFHGIFFAPKGVVSLSSFHAEIKGAVIADRIDIGNGTPKIVFDPSAGNHVPAGSGKSRLIK